MRTAVIGGTGFVGRAIVRALHAGGHEVLVVHRGHAEAGDEPAGCEHAHLDRADGLRLREALTGCDAVVDAFAMAGADAQAVVDAAADDARLVVLSSCDVYRAYASLRAGVVTDPVPLAETAPVRDGRYPYRGTIEGMDDYEKLDVEAAYLARGATVARLGFVVGAHDGQRREEPVLRRIRAGRPAMPIGAASFVGSRVLVDDVATGVGQLLAAPTGDVAGEVFNLVEAASPSSELWARWIVEDAGADLELVRVPGGRLPGDLGLFGRLPQALQCSPAKAAAVLGWRPCDPREATRRSVAWHLANPPDDVDEDFTADDAALEAAR